MRKYTRRIGIIALSFIFISSFAYPAEARTVVRTGDSVSVAEGQLIEGDFYTAAGKINVSGEVEKDMIAAGGQLTINGSVGDDALFLAAQTDIYGTIGDDLRVIGGSVTIAEPVVGDVFVIAGQVDILSTASVGGDVLVYGGEVTIEGPVGGDVLGTVDLLRIDSVVAGDIDVTVGQLTLGDRATVEGAVKYVSNELLIQALNATVVGDIVRNDPVLPGNEASVRNALVPILMLLFSVLAWFLISRRTLNLVVARALTKSPRPILLGFLTVFFAPLAIGVLIISMIGTFVGFIGVLAYLLVVMLSMVSLSAVIGQLLMRTFNHPSANLSLLTLCVGVSVVGVLMLLPYIGQVILVTALLVTVGAMMDVMLRPRAN